MNPERLSTLAQYFRHPAMHLLFFAAAVFILSKPGVPIAGAEIDSRTHIAAQDEALYTHSVLRMAAGEDWMTPRFLGRLLLVKPPLLHWLSAVSLKIFGYEVWAIRLPSVLAAAGVLAFVYGLTGPVGWALLLSRPEWRDRAGLVMMDDLLTLFYLAAVTVIAMDRKLEKRWTPWVFGALVGLAVMTKWFAGFLPLLLLVWARPRPRRLSPVMVALGAVSVPWHLYQLIVNRTWFLAEYVGVELLGYAVKAPLQSTGEGHLEFYLSRMAYVGLCAAPLLLRRWNATWLIWSGVLAAAILAYSYRNATYLIPLAPALLLAHRGWIRWAVLPLALVGIRGSTNPPQVEAIRSDWHGREILHLDADDQLRTALTPGATVRYVFLLEHLPPNGGLDFERLGIAANAGEFVANPDARVDAVLAKDIEELGRLIAGSPKRDFILPEKAWFALGVAAPHEVLRMRRKIWLRSRQPQAGPRPNQFPLLNGLGFAK